MSRLFLAFSLLFFISSCSSRLYRHRTIRVGAKHHATIQSKPSDPVSSKRIRPQLSVPEVQAKSVDGFVNLSFRGLQIKESKPSHMLHQVLVQESFGFRSNLKRKEMSVKNLVKPIHRMFAKRKVLKKPDEVKGDALLTVLALILLLAFFIGFLYLLNILFFHMTAAEFGRALLAVLIAIFVLALIVVAIGGPNG